MRPMITVFTPAYNREETLPALYESLAKQTCKDFEWVIVDDASSDGTEGLIRSYIDSKDSSLTVRYYRQEHGGKHRAVNNGVSMADGEYFFIVDSDDRLLPDAIERITAWIRETCDDPIILLHIECEYTTFG